MVRQQTQRRGPFEKQREVDGERVQEVADEAKATAFSVCVTAFFSQPAFLSRRRERTGAGGDKISPR